MSDKVVTMEDLDESMKQTEEQLDLWKLDGTDQTLAVAGDHQDVCVVNLLKSVSEVRNDYQNLKRELQEVQALQRELSGRLRAQLIHVHDKFTRLRQKLADTPPR